MPPFRIFADAHEYTTAITSTALHLFFVVVRPSDVLMVQR